MGWVELVVDSRPVADLEMAWRRYKADASVVEADRVWRDWVTAQDMAKDAKREYKAFEGCQA